MQCYICKTIGPDHKQGAFLQFSRAKKSHTKNPERLHHTEQEVAAKKINYIKLY